MDYKRIYNNIIERSKNRVLEGYCEKHHIVPKCLGGADDANNIASLTPEEHYVCHLLLTKIHPGDTRLVRAAMMMSVGNDNHQRNNKQYGWLKRQFSEIMKTNNPNKGGALRRKYIKEHGVPVVSKDYITDEWRKAISDRMTGEQNPIAGVKPWNHPRATTYTRGVWQNADNIYIIWKENNKPSYCRLYRLINNKTFNSKTIGPYMNMVKYFKNGWIPTADKSWNKFAKEQT